MPLNLRERSNEEEIMDDFALKGEDFEDGLDQIANINYWLGGNRITIASLKKMFKKFDRKIVIVDAGCGNGDMCRQIVKVARRLNQKIQVIGVDANPGTIEYAEKLSSNFPEVSYQTLDIFSKQFEDLEYDVLLATLTLHHFTDEELIPWLLDICEKEKTIIINDLHRSWLAYRLFQLISATFNLNRMNRIDGLISIKRGFKKQDFRKYNQLIKNKFTEAKISLNWKWAFRYLWIINTI